MSFRYAAVFPSIDRLRDCPMNGGPKDIREARHAACPRTLNPVPLLARPQISLAFSKMFIVRSLQCLSICCRDVPTTILYVGDDWLPWRIVGMENYGVIYADPPWRFKNFSKKGEGRNAVSHYDCMTFEELCKIPVNEWAARDCALFMWATDPMLPKALELIEAWGFEFKTVGFYWAKINKNADQNALSEKDFFTGLGYWTRANVEQCLLATKGRPKRRAKDVRRLIVDKRREHSRKPEAVYSRIERLMTGPYLELFSRETREGWDAWGDEAQLFDNGSVDTRKRPYRWIDMEDERDSQLALSV